MGINWAGVAAGYQGARSEQERIADDDRRAAAEQRAQQDAAFQEEARSRQRTDWQEQDRIKRADKEDIAAVNAEYDQPPEAPGVTDADVDAAKQAVQQDKVSKAISDALAPPADAMPSALANNSMAKDPNAPQWINAKPAVDTSNSPKLAPEVAAKVQQMAPAGGVPQPQNFNNALARQIELVRRKAARGDMAPSDYAASMAALNRMQDEGVHQALGLMAQGRYDDAMAAYNGVGAMRGAKVVSGEQGTTTINGEQMPTHYVTIRNADGTRTTMDVTKAQYQLMDLGQQINHAMTAKQMADQREHNAAVLGMEGKRLDLEAKNAAASQAIQQQHLQLARAQFDASTPAGKLALIEKTLGSSLTAEQKANMLGVDTMPGATRAQLNSLLKQIEGIDAAKNKSQAEGMWDANSAGARDMTTRSAILNQQVADLLTSKGLKPAGGADPLNLNKPASAAQSGAAAGAKPAAVPATNQPAQSAAAPAAAAAGPRVAVSAPSGIRPQGAVAPTSPVLAPVGGLRPNTTAASTSPGAPIDRTQAVSRIYQALEPSRDESMNGILRDHADQIQTAAERVRLYRDDYRRAASGGDKNAADAALRLLNGANKQFNDALAAVGTSADAARAAAGM